MFPTGERIETSFLNLIDSLRETKKYDEANLWIEKVRTRFSDMPIETNALHARLRMEFTARNERSRSRRRCFINPQKFRQFDVERRRSKILKRYSSRKSESESGSGTIILQSRTL